MSKKLFSLTTIAFIFSFRVFAQTPQAISYQAVARDATGAELISQPVGVKISIHNGSATGIVEYSETHHDTTNQFGLFTLKIGNGTPVAGTFTNIDWSTGTKFLQVELDATGGTAYSDMGTSQLVSVPYALYAEKANINLQAGNGIQISGNTITNSLPDIPVSITGTGGTTISGTYPNFNISSQVIPNGFTSNVYYDSTNLDLMNGFGGSSGLFSEIFTSPSFSQTNRLVLHLCDGYSERLQDYWSIFSGSGYPRNWFYMDINGTSFNIPIQKIGQYNPFAGAGCSGPTINTYLKGNGFISSSGIINSITLQLVDAGGNALNTMVFNGTTCASFISSPVTNNTLHPK